MKKIHLILTIMLAWIGVSNAHADLVNDHNMVDFSLSDDHATELVADTYYILQNRATSKYLVDNNGTLEFTSEAPVPGDTQDKNVNCKNYLFQATTATGGFNITGIYGASLPKLTANPIGEGEVDQQFSQHRVAADAAVYTAGSFDAATGYLRLKNNDLFLNCDLVGAQSKDAYTAWAVIPVTVTEMISVNVTCKCGTNVIQDGAIYVPLGSYDGPTFSNYTVQEASKGQTVTRTTTALTFNYDESAYTITYVYKGEDGTEWYRERHDGMRPGASYPEATKVFGVATISGVPTGTVSKARTVNLVCTSDLAFEFFPSYEKISKWYTMRIGASKNYINYDSTKEYLPLSSSISSTEDNSLYGYIGNPYIGFKIANKAAGSNKILSSTNPSTTGGTGQYARPHFMTASEIEAAGTNNYWRLQSSGSGYIVARYGETVYMNSRADHGISGESASILSFWTTANDAGSIIYFEFHDPELGESTTVTETPSTTATITDGKVYRIYSKAYAGRMLFDNGSALYTTTTKTEKELNQYWLVQTRGDGFTFRNLRTGKYIQSPTRSNRIATGDSPITFGVQKDGQAYGIGVEFTNYSCMHCDAYYNPVGWTWSAGFNASEWVFEEVGDVANEYTYTELQAIVKAFDGYAENITSGKYYKLVNYSYPSRLLTENFKETTATISGLSTTDAKAEGSQIWQITDTTRGYYTLKNVMTGKYIYAPASTSSAYNTSSTSSKFYVASSTKDNYTAPAFTFSASATSNALGIHCASSLGYKVVSWYNTADANKWYLKEVELTDEDIANLQDVYNSYVEGMTDFNNTVKNVSTYNTTLQGFFNDYACTELKSQYQSMNDADLRAAANTLPGAVKEMIVSVKNNTWSADKDATYNQYEKNFRIAPYEVYTNCNWNAITMVGPWAMLYNPTGITVEEDQVIQVYVSADAADSDAEILLHIVSDTNRYADQTETLKKGLNYIYVHGDGEVFIDYTLNNAPNGAWNGKTVSQYPNITAHIEGGKCSGMWDMHRGMTNADWAWLTENMFTNARLHAKGNSTLLNLITESVRNADQPVEVMKAWDFIFETQEKLTGCQQWIETGAYKPIINSRTSYQGNPNWDGGHGCNHPGITSSYMFGTDGLYNCGEHGGTMWEIAHEEGHGHQKPFMLAGTTEQTNNSLAMCVNFLWNFEKENCMPLEDGQSYVNRSCRQDGVKGLAERFTKGYSWMDYAGQRDCGDGYSSLWIGNKWFFQLWLYFDYLGNYQPKGGNTGYSFVTELCNKLRADRIQYGRSWNPAASTEDFLKLAKFASEVAQADLSEYFEVWGFFKEKTYNENSNDTRDSNIWYIGDYGDYYLQTSATDAANVKAYIKSQGDPIKNIMFIEDRGNAEDTWLTYNSSSGTTSTSFGETGWYANFMDGVSEAYAMNINGNTVSMTGGQGAVGFKIYDKSGNLVQISNFNSFTVSNEIAAGLANGTYTLKVAVGDGSDLNVGETSDNLTIRIVSKYVNWALKGKKTKAQVEAVADKVLKK